jgi:hypothetical protein
MMNHSIISYDSYFGFRLENYTNPPNARIYVLGVVLSYDINGIIGEYLTAEELANQNIQFLNTVVNSNAQVCPH